MRFGTTFIIFFVHVLCTTSRSLSILSLIRYNHVNQTVGTDVAAPELQSTHRTLSIDLEDVNRSHGDEPFPIQIPRALSALSKYQALLRRDIRNHFPFHQHDYYEYPLYIICLSHTADLSTSITNEEVIWVLEQVKLELLSRWRQGEHYLVWSLDWHVFHGEQELLHGITKLADRRILPPHHLQNRRMSIG